MKRAFRWFNRVLPWSRLGGVMAVLIVLTIVQWLFYGVLYLAYGALPDDWELTLVHRLAIPLVLFVWATWRSTLINPAFRTAYRAWLTTTPWTPGRALPLGPVHLVWQDAALLAAASALFWRWPAPLLVPLAFLAPYCCMLGLANYRAARDEAVFAAVMLAALLPLSLVYFARYPWAALALMCLITAVTLWGWWSTIQLFPWENLPRFVAAESPRVSQLKNPRYDRLWPRIHPLDSLDLAPRVSWRQIVMFATGTAWVAAAGLYTLVAILELRMAESGPVIDPLAGWDEWKTQFNNVCSVIVFFAGFFVALGRFGIYAAHTAAPISLLGRWATRRLFIPGYDRVFVAPLVVLGLGAATPSALLAMGVPLPAAVFASTFFIVLAAFGLGPSLAQWNLTGEHRLRSAHPTTRSRSRTSRSHAVRGAG